MFPLQKGLMGAAVATGISQTCGMLIVSSHFFLRRGRLRVGRFRISGALVRKLLLRGTPEAIAQFAVPVATLCTNYVLLARLGDMAVNAYSIICYVASFSASVFIGVSCGLQPLFGQSYGARDAQDLKWYFRAGVLIDLIGSALINIVLLFVGGPICRMFGADAQTLACTVAYMPRYAVGLHHHERKYAYISLPVFDQAHEAGRHFESVPQLPVRQRDHLLPYRLFLAAMPSG
ncbi:MAG: MATE family efflux transporter [Oscillospiraceae bacterium]